MRNVGHRSGSCRARQIAQYLGKQLVAKVHADRFAHIASALAIEAQRDAGFIKMGVEAIGLREGPDIELVGIFERDFGFVGDSLVMASGPSFATSVDLSKSARPATEVL